LTRRTSGDAARRRRLAEAQADSLIPKDLEEWERRAAAAAAVHTDRPSQALDFANDYLESRQELDDNWSSFWDDRKSEQYYTGLDERHAALVRKREADLARARREAEAELLDRSPEALERERQEFRNAFMNRVQQLAKPMLEESVDDQEIDWWIYKGLDL
jgi:hypothetical protein